MGRCRNCEYWDWEGPKCPFGKCKSGKIVYTPGNEDAPLDGLGYWDAESYGASFETGPDFGCVHFKKRESEGFIAVPYGDLTDEGKRIADKELEDDATHS